MPGQYFRRAVTLCALAVVLSMSSGCKNDEIPLVEFPKGAPPPPASSTPDPKGPQGVNTSQGDPAQYSR
jgi:hypothetical protein